MTTTRNQITHDIKVKKVKVKIIYVRSGFDVVKSIKSEEKKKEQKAT